MPNVAKSVENKILGKGLIATEIVSTEARRRIVKAVVDNRNDHQAAILAVNEVLKKYAAGFERLYPPTKLAAWVAGAREVARKTPKAVLDELSAIPPIPPIFPALVLPPEPTPLVEFPILKGAERFLEQKAAVTRETFDLLGLEYRQEAFTIAGEMGIDTIDRVRELLVEDIGSGTSLGAFRDKVEESIGESKIAPGHLELVYRSNVQTAFAEGHDRLADSPIIIEIFPFQEYIAIDDGRVRDDHLELEFLGLDGTGIYWRDDPMWLLFRPPWAFNCRCGVNLLTREAAARRGVRAAQEWIDTGVEPVHEFRLDFIPFRPEDGFVGPGSLAI